MPGPLKPRGISPEKIREAAKKGGFKAFISSRAKRRSMALERRKKELNNLSIIDKENKILSNHQRYFIQLEELYNKKYISSTEPYKQLSSIKKQLLNDYFSFLTKLKEENSLLRSMLTQIKEAKAGNRDKLISEYLKREEQFLEKLKTLADVWQNNRMRTFGP